MKKKIILTSILSIAMCLSLICGATFALFTDTDTVNVAVTSGKVNVNAVVAQDGIQVISHGETSWRTENTFLNGGTVDFSAGNTIELNLITPGDAVLFSINIENLSNIAIRYRTALRVVEGDKLFSALNVYVAGNEDTVKAAMAATDKSDYIKDGILFDGATRVSEWSNLVAAPVESNKVQETVYILVEFPYLSTDQSEYMGLGAKLAYTVEAVQGNASVSDLDQIAQNITPIYSLTDLRLVAENVKNGTSYKGRTIALMNDLDLNGMDWTPIGTKEAPFQGTFTSYNEVAAVDGTSAPATVHTIKNLKVVAGENAYAGFFGFVSGGAVISNLRFEDATIVAGKNTDAAVVASIVHSNARVENCTVVNSSVTACDYVGGIAGGMYGDIVGCTVENCELTAVPYTKTQSTVDGGAKVGGIVGLVQSDAGAAELYDNTVKNVVVKGYRDVGGLAGAFMCTSAKAERNTVENITVYVDRTPAYCEATKTNAGIGIGRWGAQDAAQKAAQAPTELGTHNLTLSGNTDPIALAENVKLTLNDATIVATEGNAITVPAGYAHTILVKGVNTLQGGTDASGIYAEGNVTIVGEAGSKLVVTANGGVDTNDGSAKGGIYAEGNVSINGVSNLVANGYGLNGYGIYGANVTITNTNISYAKGGFVQQNFIKDTSYGKKEPEGAPAIGGAVILLDNVTATKIEGGSKAAGIGARYHQATDITIKNSTLAMVIGGNASAAIGGSRVENMDGNNTVQTVDIAIINSTVNAIGGEFGAGIGSGYDTYCHNYGAGEAPLHTINISGNSNITAKGGKWAAGIGGGYHVGGISVTIASTVVVNAAHGDEYQKGSYYDAQDIGFGVINPSRDVNFATEAERDAYLANAVKNDAAMVVSTNDQLIAAINGGAQKVILARGNYALRFTNDTSFNLDGMTIVGQDGAKLSVTSTEAGYGRIQGDDVTFEKVTFVGVIGTTGEATYNNCVFEGTLECAANTGENTYANNCKMAMFHTSTDMHTGNAYLKNCTITKAEYSGFSGTTIYFENCTINELITWGSGVKTEIIGKRPGTVTEDVAGGVSYR